MITQLRDFINVCMYIYTSMHAYKYVHMYLNRHPSIHIYKVYKEIEGHRPFGLTGCVDQVCFQLPLVASLMDSEFAT